jgi:hypothetical protein
MSGSDPQSEPAVGGLYVTRVSRDSYTSETASTSSLTGNSSS